jgi:hypothetical protein
LVFLFFDKVTLVIYMVRLGCDISDRMNKLFIIKSTEIGKKKTDVMRALIGSWLGLGSWEVSDGKYESFNL